MTISSPTDIANLALDLLSAGTVTDIVDPSTPTEELLARWYDHSRRKVLRSHSWNCATKRIALAADSEDPDFGYDSQYQLPADFVRLLTVNDSTYTRDNPAPSDLYKLESNKILTSNLFESSGQLNLIYIYDLTDVSQMDALLVDLIAYELALGIAYKVTDGESSVGRIESLRKTAGTLARAVDGQESPPTILRRSRAVAARRGGSSSTSNRVIF